MGVTPESTWPTASPFAWPRWVGEVLGLPRNPSFELARVSSDGLVVTVDTAGGKGAWEVKLCKLR
jgi:hypothetical protein